MFAAPFPVEVISTILGVPPENRQQIRHWTDAMLHREEGSAMSSQASLDAGMAQGMYLFQLSQEKRAEPADDMLTALIDAEVETDTGELVRLNDAEIAEFGTLLAAAGSETVTKLVGNAMVLFHRHPDQWAKVLDDPSVIANAVEEILRYWAPSQYQGRYSVVDSEWHGVTIPKHKPVFLITGGGQPRPPPLRRSRQIRHHPRPRPVGRAGPRPAHVSGRGAGPPGEAGWAIEEIARRWPAFEVNEEGLRRVQMSNVAGYSSVPITVS